ncbi:phage tail tape measure protein [Streptomyces sp. 8L]|uniref:phage tail tape measure protein n=1 Tax=Streptomyces sp. 8L TaxID=2877242 RepID=UPI001CD6BFDB|nr:phage tail tape measure protein [Streptomyces sp. 8L]MCA1220248.1 phage tail tape measure protein [Streptomyces sp. 8L]
MPNWNLSVDLRASGSSLSRELTRSATAATTLADAAKVAKTEIAALGTESERAATQLRSLGTAARTAERNLARLGTSTDTVVRALARYGTAARDADSGLARLGTNTRTAGDDMRRMSSQITTAVRDLTRLATAATRASSRMDGLGARGVTALHRLSGESEGLRSKLMGLAALLSGGALFVGIEGLIHQGNEYQSAMNSFGAATNASQAQMRRAADVANQLGNDLNLPKTTAADAADAMLDLAKAGFRTDQAITAANASLQLSAATGANAANSAKYLGDMMDEFGLGADQASQAADVLAATSTNASGGIQGVYNAMKYAGPIAHAVGINMTDAATGVGMLAKAGIIGSQAGTTLRTMLTNLSRPTKQMQSGLDALGISAFDAQGKFKGMRPLVEDLSKAMEKMPQKDFLAAASKAFGKPALTGAVALAHQGTQSFDAFNMTVSQTGVAARQAAAAGKGLTGAMTQLKTQSKQTGQAIYQGMAPGLEWMARGLTKGLADATPKITSFFDYLNDAATLFKPGLEAEARKEFSGIGDAAKSMVAPFKEIAEHGAADGLNVLLNVGSAVVTVLKNLGHAIEPVLSALGDMADGSSGAASSLDTVVYAVDTAASAVSSLSGVLVPIGHIVGSLVSDFGKLPGPVQQAVLAMLLMRRVTPMMTGLASTVGGRLTGAYSSLNRQILVQQSQARRAGQSISTMSAAYQALVQRVPVIGRMGESFRTAQTQVGGFAGSVRGVTAAVGTGLKGAMGGLVGVMGGPWGVALTGVTVGLGLLASAQQKASQEAAEHASNIANLTSALQQSNGVIDESVRQQAAQTIQNTKLTGSNQNLISVLGKAGYSLSDVTDAYLGQGDSVDSLADKMDALAVAQQKNTKLGAHGFGIFDKRSDSQKAAQDQITAYAAAAKALRGMSGDAKTAAKNAKDLGDATKGTQSGTNAYDSLKASVSALADKTGDADDRTRALRDALDLLSGGSISLQAAQERVNEAVTNANEAMDSGIKKTDGWGKALIATNGSLNTASKNGQQLYQSLNSIADASSDASIAAFDFAQKQGKSVPQSIAAATKQMQANRDSAVKLAEGYGLTKKQAQGVADSMGLIPSKVGILLETKGVDGALADLLAVQAAFKQVPNSKTIKVDSLSTDAKKDLQDLGYQISLIPGTRQYKITAPTKDARNQLDLLISKLGQTNGKNVTINADTAKAINQLQGVQDKIRGTKGKSVTINALTATAEAQLKDLGFKVTHLKNGKVSVSVPTGGPKAAVSSIQGAINSLHGKTVTNHVNTVYSKSGGSQHDAGNPYFSANGNIFRYYAAGGVEDHVAQMAPAGAMRVWAEPETGGEAYIPLAQQKRPRSRLLAEETIRRLGGDPSAIRWNANGSIMHFDSGGFTYTPNAPLDTLGAGSAQDRYSTALQKLTDAMDKLKDATTKAQKASANRAINAADAALGLRAGTKTTAFNLSSYQKELSLAVTANSRWESDLAKIGKKAGGDIEDTLRGMGEEGRSLVGALAQASTKQFNAIVANLKKLAPTAKAVLADYTNQLNASNKTSTTFQSNLAKLASMGYGSLALQLAGQGDDTAQAIAAQAAASKSSAAKANTAAAANAKVLSSDELAELVQIIAAIKTSTTGIHTVADSTGLGEDDIVTVATKASAQIKASLGDRSTKFLADLARAQKGLSYANGGIRAGMYATQGGLVRFAEPETGGEAYIPLSPTKRASATAVLQDVAGRFGLGATTAHPSAGVTVIRQEGDTHITVSTVRTDASGSDIGAQVARSYRRARRGGVNARG